MNIIVPIHLEALRAAPSSEQNAKTALYDFEKLGQNPASSMGGLIASNQFETAQTSLGSEPGIHLHWTLPRAYTRGAQDETTGQIRYPVVPNRWLVIRYFKDNTKATGNTRIRLWVLESDAHSDDQGATNSPTAIPWMNDRTDLQGLQGNFVGRRIDLSESWTEPTSTLKASAPGNGDVGFLGEMFQATYGYGETFTAFYPNCSNVLGIYDDLTDYFANPNTQLENNSDFTASYTVMGWVSSTASDECNVIVNQAIAAYKQMTGDKPDFPSYLQGVFQQNLGWSLSSFEGFTPANATGTQGVLAGILSDVTWKIANPGNPTYPTALPSSDGVQVSIGNNTPEALSAYIDKLEARNAALLTGDGIDSNMEWLLNALQFNQLHELSAGDRGIGQLQQYLHSATFATVDAGYEWSVRQKQSAEPGSQDQSADNEIVLPPYLSKVLAELNGAQRALDIARADIATRQQQLFFDWTHHITAINDNVVNGSGSIGQDNTGAFLTVGMFDLYPQMQMAGNFVEAGLPSAAYAPAPDSFSIAIPPDFPSSFEMNLPSYTFNAAFNTVSGDVVSALMDLSFGMDQTAGLLLPSAIGSLTSAQALLKLAEPGGKDADDYIASARTLITKAGNELGLAMSALVGLGGTNGIAAQKFAVDSARATWAGVVDANTGIFAKYLKYTADPGKAPLPPGQTYTGQLGDASAGDIGTWAATGDGFVGIKAQMDVFTGQGKATPQAVDASLAAFYLGYAYFFVNSQFVFKSSAAYYLQMCEDEVTNALTAATNAGARLGDAATALAGSAMSGLIADLNAMVTTGIQTTLSDLDLTQPDVAAALSELAVMLAPAGSPEPSIPGFQAVARGSDWATLRGGIETARYAVAGQLPKAQQVSIGNSFLFGKVNLVFDLTAAPADTYRQPNDPVILMAQDKSDDEDILAPFSRNGKAQIVPCRLTTELVADASVTYPSPIDTLSTSMDTRISGLSDILQALAQEAYLLSPELSTAVSAADLETAATDNVTLHYNATNNVVLQDAPSPLTGKLPYYIAYNWRKDMDPFIPLFIWWGVNYRFSQTFQHTGQSYPSDFLDQFQVGQYEVELQPTSQAMANFGPGSSWTNGFSFHGLISLSSSATTSLTSQIQIYCTNYLNYDPASGPPHKGIDDYDEALRFYDAYQDYKTRDVLSQGLSGFNSGLVTRAQELQIPINIPKAWTTTKGFTLNDFWPTQMLHGQSTDWPVEWNSEGPNTDAYNQGAAKVYFNPLRAGFLEIEKITLVDSFGRFVDIANPTPYAISENMTASQTPPDAAHSTYLAPRLVQPSRVDFNWISARTQNGIDAFAEPASQPSSSPICGWIWPNHLDDSIMLYDSGGRAMGSLRARGTDLHWFPVPGQTTQAGANNRDQMVAYFNGLNANPVFVAYVTNFLYQGTSAASTTRFQSFLEVLRKAQAFIVTPAMLHSTELAVLMGRPLVITQANIALSQRGGPMVGLNGLTYPAWNADGPQFTNNPSSYIPYEFGNFNTGNVSGVRVKCRVGMSEIQKTGGINIPYFDDGVAGYFLGEAWDTLFTPVDMTSTDGIISVAAAGSTPLSLTPSGPEQLLTLVMDPTAAVHATTGLLPSKSLAIPPNLYSKVLARLQITFLSAPVLRAQNPPALPLPPERGYAWSWVEVGSSETPIKPAQGQVNAAFPESPQSLVDGWLKLTEQSN